VLAKELLKQEESQYDTVKNARKTWAKLKAKLSQVPAIM